MKSIMVAVIALALAFACAKEEEQPSSAVEVAAAAAPAAPDPKGDLKELEAAFAQIVETKRAGDNTKRRDLCLELEPKVAARLETGGDAKLQTFASQLGSFCPEAIESRKLMAKAAEPEAPMPELSPTMKRMFTASTLKSDLKKAKKLAKRKGDPEDVCKKIGLTARVVGEKRKLNKKTKKLLQQATSFCEGPATVATVRFHLRAAALAEKNGQAVPFSEHCTHALAKLHDFEDGKRKKRLDHSVKELCREAYALKPMLDSRGG